MQLLTGLGSLSPTRRAALAKELEALVEAMGIDDEPAGMFFETPARAKTARRAASSEASPSPARRHRPRPATSASRTASRRR